MQDPRDEYQIINDIIPKSYQDLLATELAQMPWYWFPSSSGEVEVDENDKNVVDNVQMQHVFADENGIVSQYFSLIQPMIWFLEKNLNIDVIGISRIKANLMSPYGTTLDNYNLPHIDSPREDSLSMVYYVNESDGDTRIFHKTVDEGVKDLLPIASVAPKKGRALIFKSNRFHASTPPVKYKSRMVLNYVLTIGT
jgi:hypothetical protein